MLKKNILANYLGAGLSILSPLLALPWYLEAFGSKQWGLISFMYLLQTIMGVLDVGLSQALVREFALRLDLDKVKNQVAASLLFSLERVYWIVAICLGLLIVVLIKPITEFWLNLGDVSTSSGYSTVLGAAALLVGYLPGSLYRSVLVGGQYQVRLNSIVISSVVVRHGCGVLLATIWPLLEVYICWYIFTIIVETFLRGYFAWKVTGTNRNQCQWQFDEIRRICLFALSMSGAVVLGVLTVQVDKIVVSAMLSIEQFAYYSIASSVAMGGLQLFYPVMQAALPHIVGLKNDFKAMKLFNIKLSLSIVSAMGLVIVVYVLLGEKILELWLRDPVITSSVYPILSLLLVGTALNALYNVGYLNWIANAKTKRILTVNTISFVLAICFTPLLVGEFGAIGAASSWLIINSVGVLMSMDWLKITRYKTTE